MEIKDKPCYRGDLHQSGFTLMEVLVALLIMSLCLTLILEGLDGAHRLARRSRRYSRMVPVAEAVMGELMLCDKDLKEMAGDDKVVEKVSKGSFLCSVEIEKFSPLPDDAPDREGFSLYRVKLRMKSGQSTSPLVVETALP